MTVKNIKSTMKENTPVYYVDQNTLEVLRGTIIGFNAYNSNVNVEIEIEYNESTYEKNYDTIYTTSNTIFANINDALDYQENQRQYKISQYRSEIKNIDDLLRFPLNHQLKGDDYNECALEAYMQKAKELYGIEL